MKGENKMEYRIEGVGAALIIGTVVSLTIIGAATVVRAIVNR